MDRAGQRNAGAASNQYQILGHLATGGMAELYLARAVGIAGFERYVVLKRIMAEHARNHRFVTMFLDEARLAAQLHHPNIAQVYDIGRVSDSYFFTMEYVHGENVRDVLQRVAALKRQIPIEVTLTVIAGAAAGLHYAHDKRGINRQPLGIVHRDVSPSNLMVAYEGAVKLVDFGIAKASHRMTETRSGAVKGKVAYMSPEQCTGHPLDRRSDVFSLGIVLFEMATMTRLFKHLTDFETMSHIVNHPVPSPSARRADLPRELEQIILKALAKKPDDRYQTAGELLEAIEQFASRERLALSNMGLSRYVRDLFGERPEPWYELEAAGEETGLVTIETAALAPVVEPDPFAPNSTQRSLGGGVKPAPREWGATGPVAAVTPTAFAENAAPTAPYRPDPLRRASANLDAAAAPTLLTPAEPMADPPRKPSTNPAVAPPPPARITGPQARTTGPQVQVAPRATISGHAPPPSGTGMAPRLVTAPTPVVAPPPEEAVTEPGTVVGAHSAAQLVVQEPEVVRDTPDREPSWGGERDPSWRGRESQPDVRAAPRSRRWMVWAGLSSVLVLGGVLVLIAGDDGRQAASRVDASAPRPVAAPPPSAPAPVAPPEVAPPTPEVAPPTDPLAAELPIVDPPVADRPADPPAGARAAAGAVEPPPGRTGPSTRPGGGKRGTSRGGKHAAGKGADGATRPPPPPPRKCGDPLGLYPPCE
ncbi:MAG: protein kinase [Myxococcales bacterium]|nr:protein kinase [Myxococcales bacterium]MBK7197712.1 protein kinase [Myxococcales bacterium]MBP6847643.1 protein kinase [Kofleriaceae bacterium]